MLACRQVSVSVQGFYPDDVKYRAVEMAFIDPAQGSAAAVSAGCGTIGYAYTAVATLNTYPDYAGPLNVSGTITITETDAGISILGTVAGLEASTSGGIHVHEGVSCAEVSEVGAHFYPGLAVDPWLDTMWASNANGAASVSFPMAHFAVGNGDDEQNVANRAVVVHDSSGARVACGVLASTPGEVLQVAGYPGYAGAYADMTGTLVVSNLAQGDGVSFVGTLANLEASTSGGLHVHQGLTVDDADGVGGHYYDPSYYAVDPWCSSGCASVWTSDASGASNIAFQMMNFTVGAAQAVDLHAMVIHLSNGTRAGAGLISTTAASSFVASSSVAVPTPSPTMMPTMTYNSSAVPTPSPTMMPTMTYNSTPSPTVLPSLVPTVTPTTTDNSKLAVSLTLSSSATPTEASKDALKSVIAQSIFGVDDDSFQGDIMVYEVSNVSSTASYIWDVTFDVSASLSVVNEANTGKWAASVESTFTSVDFTTAASSATGVALAATSATASDARRRMIPTPTPTLVPTPIPTSPKPTTADTVQVAVVLSISSDSKLTNARANTLKSTIASELGVSTSNLKDYEYSYTASTLYRRKLTQTIVTYDWSVECTVEVSLATTGAASVEDFAGEVGAELSSTTFQANVAVNLGVIIISVSATSTPVIVPTPTSDTNVQSASLASWAIALIAGAGFVCLAGSALAGFMYIRRGDGGGGGGSCFGSHWGKFRAEAGDEETNPLGVDYPKSFSGGSVLAQHDEL